MKYKRWRFTFFSIIMVIILTGCGKTDIQETEQAGAVIEKSGSGENIGDSEVKLAEFPKTYENKKNELVQFQARVIVPEGIPAEVRTDTVVSYISLDFEKALQTFVPKDMDSLTRETYPDNEEEFPYETAYNDQMEFSNAYYSFFMQTKKWKKLRYAMFDAVNVPEYNIEIYEKEQTFPFGTPEEVFGKLEEKVRDLGLCTELQCTSFYPDYMTLQEQYVPMEEETAQAAFEPEDSGYYYSAVQTIEGLPVYACYYYGSGIEGGYEAANIMAYVDGNGLEMLRMERIIDQIVYGDKREPLLPLEEIAGAIDRHFSLVITDNRVKVKELKLCYMTEPIDKLRLRLLPVWMCNYEVTDSQGSCFAEQILMNAVTAEEVIYELK